MVDQSVRPLKIPPKFIPYLETHRIYELFQELSKELIIHQPSDHIQFLYDRLKPTASKKDRVRTIIMGSPDINLKLFAKVLARDTGAVCITVKEVFKAVRKDYAFYFKKVYIGPPDVVTQIILGMIDTDDCVKNGWILIGYPRTRPEALSLQRGGVLPTHVILIKDPPEELVVSKLPKRYVGLLARCFPTKGSVVRPEPLDMSKHREKSIIKFKRHLTGIIDAYKNILKEIPSNIPAYDILKICKDFVKSRSPPGAPYIPRAVFIGPPGGGKKTQVKILQKRFNIVHVDFDHLMAKVRQDTGKYGKAVRILESRRIPIFPDILLMIIERRLLQDDCMKYGWILTEFPRNVDEAMLLDIIETPPNRIVFFDMCSNECRDRLLDSRINMYTGSKCELSKSPKKDINILAQHPKDKEESVKDRLMDYLENNEDLQQYYQFATHVDAEQEVGNVTECLEIALVNPPAPGPPRQPEEDVQVWKSGKTISQIFQEHGISMDEGEQPDLFVEHASECLETESALQLLDVANLMSADDIPQIPASSLNRSSEDTVESTVQPVSLRRIFQKRTVDESIAKEPSIQQGSIEIVGSLQTSKLSITARDSTMSRSKSLNPPHAVSKASKKRSST